MNYIVNLFRSRQQDGEFLFAPFSDAQWAAMQEGRVPRAAVSERPSRHGRTRFAVG